MEKGSNKSRWRRERDKADEEGIKEMDEGKG